jgi:histidinol-phosphate/aromatic aminotransferase/cobyric acid decarboxylase-like protein
MNNLQTRVSVTERKRLDLDAEFTYLSRNMLVGEHPSTIHEGMLEYVSNDGLSLYPDMERLYEKLGRYLAIGYDYVDSFSMENLLITYGVEGAFKTVFETYDLVGESVGVLTPTCAMMHVYAEAFGVNVIKLSGNAPDYEITVDKIMDIIPKIKVLFMDNPKCHMENYLNSDEVWEIVNCAEYHGVLVFLDEIYTGYGTEGFLKEGSFDIDRFDNLIVSSSFSKSHMLPSLKFGWLLTDKKTKIELETTRYTYESSYPTCSIAEYVCDNPEYFEYFRESVVIKRDKFMEQMVIKERADISSHVKSFMPHAGYIYNIRLYSEDKQHVNRINQNFLDNKLVVGTHEDMNLYFSIPLNDDVERAVYRSLEMGDKHE